MASNLKLSRNCKKWLNPNNPEELAEIQFGKGNIKLHKRNCCPVNSSYTARLIMSSHHHQPLRLQSKERIDKYARY